MNRLRASRRVEVRPGHKAIAPRVDHPRGYALENQSGGALIVSFTYDETKHVMTVVVEEPRPARRLAEGERPEA